MRLRPQSTACITLAGLAALPAVAQTTSEPVVLQDIVVTARKTEERLQDVPLAVSAFDANAIRDAGIEDLSDVAGQTPGLVFFTAFGEDLPTPVIRGVSQTQIFGENNVALFVDGAYVSGRAGVNFSQLDIERIEVVKGPQSAMYGRGSFSGAINIITARPTDEFEGEVLATAGQDGTLTGKLVLSGPISDRVKARLALGHDEWDGSYDNANPGGGPEIGGYEHNTFDGSLLVEPTDNLTLLVKAYYSDDQNYSPAMSEVLANCEDSGAAPPTSPSGRLQNFCGTLQSVGTGDLAVIRDASGQSREILRGNVTLDWTLAGGGTLSAISGYSDVATSARYDASRGSGDLSIPFLYQTTAGPGSNAVLYTGLLQDDPEDSTEEFSQEIRYTSPEDRSVRWSIGGYYWKADTTARPNRPFSTQSLPDDFNSFLPVLAQLPFPPYTVFFSLGDAAFLPWFGETQPITRSSASTESYSAFGHVEADLTETLTGRVELRYSDEKDDITQPSGNSASDSWSFATGRASLTWKPTVDSTYYAAVARGMKSGGFDYDSNTDTFRAYDPEELWSYELGSKIAFWERRGYLDLAVYYMDWSDIIIPTVDDSVTPPVAFDGNAGTATSKGVELTLTLQATEYLTLSLGGAWNDAKYDDASLSSLAAWPSFAPDGDVSGNRLLRQARTQANASATYRAPVRGDWEWYTRFDVNYLSKQYIGADNQGIIPSQTLSNLRLGLDSGRYRIEVWGLNLFDEDAPVAAFRDVVFSNSPDGQRLDFFPWRLSVSHPERRRFGVTASVRF